MKYHLLNTRRLLLSISSVLLFTKWILCQSSIEVLSNSSRSESFLVNSSALPWASNINPISLSYAGLITVRQTSTYQAKLFFWFFPCTSNPQAPLMIWLQGGPFSSSMSGLFLESGPLRIQTKPGIILSPSTQNETINDFILSTNPFTWNQHFNMVFLDQPVGTGFSFVDPPIEVKKTNRKKSQAALFRRSRNQCSDPFECTTFSVYNTSEDSNYQDGYVKNQKGIAQDFLSFLEQFYQRFPSMREVNLTISSESYGGKYVPSIATAITEHNLKFPNDQIPLKSLTIGNQWTDPYTQVATNIDQLLWFGLISTQQASNASILLKKSQSEILKKNWTSALTHRLEMFEVLSNYTGGVNWYDVRMKNDQIDQKPMNHFLRCNETKTALNVPTQYRFGQDDGMFEIFQDDIMQSTKDLFPELFKRYKVLLYQGNMDLRDGVASNTAWLSSLNWDGRREFEMAPRKVWKSITGELYGYVTQSDNLSRVILLGCGHLVPADNGCPSSSLEMMIRHHTQSQFI
ncbi:serine carboxypeptidase [Melampsora americana]|nr:serine carboxypeptidase [Melampsora americana]